MTAPGLIEHKGLRPLTWITAYDYVQAQVSEQAMIDVILVGDSLGMTTMGYADTIPVTVDDMVYHARMVRRGAPNTMMVVDLPFLSYATVTDGLRNSARIMQESLADAVKLEGGRPFLDVVDALIKNNIPVIGHLGLTPQSVHKMGGYRVQAKTADRIQDLMDDAQALAEHGVSAIVLEGIPDRVAQYVTENIPVPTIGIGAGQGVDGQVLVFHDCLGLSSFYPKFAKPFRNIRQQMLDGLIEFRESVINKTFPDQDHSYHIADEEWARFMTTRNLLNS